MTIRDLREKLFDAMEEGPKDLDRELREDDIMEMSVLLSAAIFKASRQLRDEHVDA